MADRLSASEYFVAHLLVISAAAVSWAVFATDVDAQPHRDSYHCADERCVPGSGEVECELDADCEVEDAAFSTIYTPAPSPGSSPSTTPRPCSAANCNDGNPCTTDGCRPDGSCFHIPRSGFVPGCSDQGNPSDCNSYFCNSSGVCELDKSGSGESCTILKTTPLGSGSCAGTRYCETTGKCSGTACKETSSSVTTCVQRCGSGSPGSETADATCCRSRDCSSFTGCGTNCTPPEEQAVRCCTYEGKRISCGYGYTCSSECGCIPEGAKCPAKTPEPTPSPNRSPSPAPSPAR